MYIDKSTIYFNNGKQFLREKVRHNIQNVNILFLINISSFKLDSDHVTVFSSWMDCSSDFSNKYYIYHGSY